MKPMGISARQLAADIDVSPSRISALVNGQRPITADTAIRLGLFFFMEPRFWLNLQSEYDIRVRHPSTTSESQTGNSEPSSHPGSASFNGPWRNCRRSPRLTSGFGRHPGPLRVFLLLADDDCKTLGRKVLHNNHLDGLMHGAIERSSKAHGEMQPGGSRVAHEPIDVDRTRKATFRRIARKPAPMLVPNRSTVKVTVSFGEAVLRALRIKSFDGSLVIKWDHLGSTKRTTWVESSKVMSQKV